MKLTLPELDIRSLARFEPRRDWFCRPPAGIHGIEHETRVLVLSQILGAMESAAGAIVDRDAIAWAAVIHDTQRLDDSLDPEHGVRAAEWIQTNSDVLPRSTLVEPVAYICRWHASPDNQVPQLRSDLRVLKGADALDRWRIGDLDPTYLRTESSRLLLSFSRCLWSETQGVGRQKDAFHRVLAAGQRLCREWSAGEAPAVIDAG